MPPIQPCEIGEFALLTPTVGGGIYPAHSSEGRGQDAVATAPLTPIPPHLAPLFLSQLSPSPIFMVFCFLLASHSFSHLSLIGVSLALLLLRSLLSSISLALSHLSSKGPDGTKWGRIPVRALFVN